tara:strand:+ start:66 stop:272 length:207 start_codon:yes stop_codon:yes gene_type:complete
MALPAWVVAVVIGGAMMGDGPTVLGGASTTARVIYYTQFYDNNTSKRGTMSNYDASTKQYRAFIEAYR